MGLKREQVAQPEDVECWPDNWEVFQVFRAMETQWNNNGYGVIGFRYESIPVALRMVGVAQEDESGVIVALQIMELEALGVINKK